MGPQLDKLVSCAFVYAVSNCPRVCIVWNCLEPKMSPFNTWHLWFRAWIGPDILNPTLTMIKKSLYKLNSTHEPEKMLTPVARSPRKFFLNLTQTWPPSALSLNKNWTPVFIFRLLFHSLCFNSYAFLFYSSVIVYFIVLMYVLFVKLVLIRAIQTSFIIVNIVGGGGSSSIVIGNCSVMTRSESKLNIRVNQSSSPKTSIQN